MAYAPATPTDDQIARLTERLIDLSERMTDEQVLDVADALHDRLRERRRLRGRSHRRVEGRLHHSSFDMRV
jgi:hypothetical protein